MDEKIVEPMNSQVTEQSQVAVNPSQPNRGNRNLILAIVALVIGAAIIAGVFVAAFPKEATPGTTVTQVTTAPLTKVSKASDLNTASQELNSTNLDQYQTDLNLISTSF